MTTKQGAALLDRMIALVKIPGHDHDDCPWPQVDRLDQEQLYEIINATMKFLEELAFTLGPRYEDKIARELPWAFKSAVPA